jgi:predicted transcriptional regulator
MSEIRINQRTRFNLSQITQVIRVKGSPLSAEELLEFLPFTRSTLQRSLKLGVDLQLLKRQVRTQDKFKNDIYEYEVPAA